MPNDSNALEFDRDHQYRMKLDRLLKVAAGSFNRKGYSGTSLKDVAAQLNITDAALYYYVKNKEELVFMCYQRALDLGEAALEKASAEGANGLARVRTYVQHQIDALCGPSGPVAILSEIPSLKQAHRDVILERTRRASRAFAGFIRSGIDDGSIRPCDPELACAAVMGALNWVPKWYRAGTAKYTPQQVAETYIDLITSGLAAPVAPGN